VSAEGGVAVSERSKDRKSGWCRWSHLCGSVSLPIMATSPPSAESVRLTTHFASIHQMSAILLHLTRYFLRARPNINVNISDSPNASTRHHFAGSKDYVPCRFPYTTPLDAYRRSAPVQRWGRVYMRSGCHLLSRFLSPLLFFLALFLFFSFSLPPVLPYSRTPSNHFIDHLASTMMTLA
jgi:hypothetical protein